MQRPATKHTQCKGDPIKSCDGQPTASHPPLTTHNGPIWHPGVPFPDLRSSPGGRTIAIHLLIACCFSSAYRAASNRGLQTSDQRHCRPMVNLTWLLCSPCIRGTCVPLFSRPGPCIDERCGKQSLRLVVLGLAHLLNTRRPQIIL